MSKRNKKVIINIGVPASGKSTWTRDYLAKNPNTVCVSRDDFRFMFRNTPVTEPKIEDLITDLVNTSILKALMRGCDVIIDATNLKSSYINTFVDLVKFKADVEFRIHDISLETAIERDSKRERKVGEHVIRKMFKDYKNLLDSHPLQNISKKHEHEDKFIPLKQDTSLEEAVIFDIDGNIASMGRRSPFDWDKVDVDDPIDVVIEQIKLHKTLDRTILLVSGRDGAAREKTEYWLNFYNIPYDFLFMRPKDNVEKDFRIKKRIFDEQIKDKYNVIAVYDDRLQVCINAWYELGLFCFCTNQGLKEF